jgi:hypothetical protein
VGCYTTRPIAGQSTALGSTLLININDAGRAALAGSMGPSISEIEGRLLERDSSVYVLAVAQIHMFGGGDQVWSGERVRIKSEFVNTVSEKKFSRTKTGLISAAAVGVVAIVLSKGLGGFLAGDDGKLPPDTGITAKYPRFGR